MLLFRQKKMLFLVNGLNLKLNEDLRAADAHEVQKLGFNKEYSNQILNLTEVLRGIFNISNGVRFNLLLIQSNVTKLVINFMF